MFLKFFSLFEKTSLQRDFLFIDPFAWVRDMFSKRFFI
ncbi:hypothetical protein EFW58_04155 [Bacillus velezensis]|nr:hypothetical protein EFW58_04155 [Bacillus velezensis]